MEKRLNQIKDLQWQLHCAASLLADDENKIHFWISEAEKHGLVRNPESKVCVDVTIDKVIITVSGENTRYFVQSNKFTGWTDSI